MQAHDVPWAAIPTMGEAWHNGHHAYPGSARIGLHPGQSDWGYAFIRLCERLGLVWHVRTPETMGDRPGLTETKRHATGRSGGHPVPLPRQPGMS